QMFWRNAPGEVTPPDNTLKWRGGRGSAPGRGAGGGGVRPPGGGGGEEEAEPGLPLENPPAVEGGRGAGGGAGGAGRQPPPAAAQGWQVAPGDAAPSSSQPGPVREFRARPAALLLQRGGRQRSRPSWRPAVRPRCWPAQSRHRRQVMQRGEPIALAGKVTQEV